MALVFHSLAGFGALLAALLMGGASLWSYLSHDAKQKAQWWTFLVLTAGYVLLGTGFYRHSYEATRESPVTSLIFWSGIGVLVIGFVCSRSKWKKQQAER